MPQLQEIQPTSQLSPITGSKVTQTTAQNFSWRFSCIPPLSTLEQPKEPKLGLKTLWFVSALEEPEEHQHGKFTTIGSPYNIFRCLSCRRFSRRLSFHLSLVTGSKATQTNCTEFQLTLQFHPSPFHSRTAKGTQIRPENTLICLCTRRTGRTQHGKFTIIGSPYNIFRCLSCRRFSRRLSFHLSMVAE